MQALWTMARENLDVTVVIFANRAYRILVGELANVGGGVPRANASAMLALGRSYLDWRWRRVMAWRRDGRRRWKNWRRSSGGGWDDGAVFD